MASAISRSSSPLSIQPQNIDEVEYVDFDILYEDSSHKTFFLPDWPNHIFRKSNPYTGPYCVENAERAQKSAADLKGIKISNVQLISLNNFALEHVLMVEKPKDFDSHYRQTKEMLYKWIALDPSARKQWKTYFFNMAEFILRTHYTGTIWCPSTFIHLEEGFHLMALNQLGAEVDPSNYTPSIKKDISNALFLLAKEAPEQFREDLEAFAKNKGFEEPEIASDVSSSLSTPGSFSSWNQQMGNVFP